MVSVAWIVPTTPGRTPKTPASAHDGTRPGAAARGRCTGSTGLPSREHRRLALEPEDGPERVGLPEQHARVVHQVARREVVGAVEHDVVPLEDAEGVADVRRTRCISTLTFGLMARRRSLADSTFGRPVPAVSCRI